MKRLVTSAMVFALCLALPTSVCAKSKKTSSVDMSNVHSIFVGWVDLNPSAYSALRYKSKDAWVAAINKANADFQQQCASRFFAGRRVSGAKNSSDQNPAENHLYIRFDDVVFDTSYILHVSAHLIDVKENKELATISDARYRGRLCALEGCITKELDMLGADLQAIIAPELKSK